MTQVVKVKTPTVNHILRIFPFIRVHKLYMLNLGNFGTTKMLRQSALLRGIELRGKADAFPVFKGANLERKALLYIVKVDCSLRLETAACERLKNY